MNCFCIGLISDTHGLVRDSALQALQGVSLIVHAGDIGGPEVIEALQRIAPVVAVRGNMDCGGWADELPLSEVVEVGGASLYVLHDLGQLNLNPAAAGFCAVVCGHSHRPAMQTMGGVSVLNPGSAGPQRQYLPVSLMRLYVADGAVHPELVFLQPEEAGGGR